MKELIEENCENKKKQTLNEFYEQVRNEFGYFDEEWEKDY
jgi:archaellum component FlaC